MMTQNSPDIRPETAELADSIRRLLLAAFPTADEAAVVDELRAAGAMPVSLVAVDSGGVVGHIAFSPVSIPPQPPTKPVVLALAPLAVAPEAQGRGIGSALVRTGLKICAEGGVDGVVVLGDPAYYGRFGFKPAAERGMSCLFDAPPEAFMIWEHHSGTLSAWKGIVCFNPAFDRFLGPHGDL